MQAAASPWTMKTLPMLGNHIRDPTRLAGASSSFHTTPASFAKWRNKWECHKSEKGARKASRNYERYVVRKKRAEGKKALKIIFSMESHRLIYMMEAQVALLIHMQLRGSKHLGKDLNLTGHRTIGKVYTSRERVKRTRKGSATSSMRTIMCTLMTCLKPSLVQIMILLGLTYRGRVFTLGTNRSDLDGVVVNHAGREFQVTAKMKKARMRAGKQPALVHMPTESFLDYHHVVH